MRALAVARVVGLAVAVLLLVVAGVALAQEAAATAPRPEGVSWAVAGPVAGAMAMAIGILFWQLRAETSGRLADAQRYGAGAETVAKTAEKLTLLAEHLTRGRRL